MVTPLDKSCSLAFETIQNLNNTSKNILVHTKVWFSVSNIKAGTWYDSNWYGVDMGQ